MLTDLGLTIVLVLLNGFFVAAEFAIVKVRASQLELLVRSGSFLARFAQTIVNNLNGYLSATQVGITLTSLGLGWFAERISANLAEQIVLHAQLELSELMIHTIALPIAFGFITFLHIVFGELIPKAIAIRRSESTAMAAAIPLRVFAFTFRPFIWVLDRSANAVLLMLGIAPSNEHDLHTPDEIRYLLEESRESGAMEEEEHEFIENVFDLKQTEVRQIMVPRPKIAAIDASMPSSRIIDKVIDEGYSRLPVYQGTIDTIVGTVFSKDLLALVSYSSVVILQDLMHPAVFVQESDKIADVLRRMKREHFHLAVVLDEFGGTAGVVTLEDVIEEIVGEIQDEHDDEAQPVEERSSEFFVKAATSIADLNEYLPIALEESEEYDTLGGLLNSVAGRIPQAGEEFSIPGYHAMIVEASKRAILTVRLRRLESPEAAEALD